MAQRCPDAVNPRRAVLADHDWLINQRGVATVEPLHGASVHGVVWDVSDHDLVALDSAEGVPVRYRRDELTVQAEDGPAEAWVYIDHRVRLGPPRPGYLERIIDGALHHGLPEHWIDFLRRWDPSRWPRPRPRPTTPAPQSFSELLADDDVVEASRLRSRFGFLAIHGGGLEQMTDVIAERAADEAGASVYLVRHPDRYPHHLASARFVRGRVRATGGVPRPRRRRGVVARLRADRPRHATAGRWRQSRAGSPCCPAPGPAGLSRRHRARRHPAASCAACTRRTRLIRPVTAECNWSCRSGSGASARAARCPAPTACPR